MLRSFALLLLISSIAIAQASAPQQASKPAAPSSQPAAPAAPKAAENPGANLPPETAVITIKHLCATPAAPAGKGATAKSSAKTADCNTVITKAEFEKVLNAVIPKARRAELPPTAKQQIAQQFSNMLVMATAAQKHGVERKDPNIQEALKLSRQQVLAQALNQQLMDDSTPSDVEMKKYYDQNSSAYDEVTLQRLFIPKANSTSKDKPSDPATEKADADKIRSRAAAGEDFDKLQKEAFANTPNPQGAPSTQMGARRRGSLSPDQESVVFSTSVGQVTQLFDNPAGFYVYKIVSKRTVPYTEVKDEILHKLQQQKYMDARNAITNSVQTEFNEKYFGGVEGARPAMPAMPGMGARPTSAPAPEKKPGAPPPPPPPGKSSPTPQS